MQLWLFARVVVERAETYLSGEDRTFEQNVQRLNEEVGRALKLADVRERIESFGGQVRHSTPEEFARFIRAEFDRWGPVIKQAGVRVGD